MANARDSWWYNHSSGNVSQGKDFLLPYDDKAKPDSRWEGPFNTKSDALKYYADNHAAHPDWKEPTDKTWKQFQNSTVSGGEAVVEGTQDLFMGTDVGNWLIRIGEIVLGIVLIGVGLARITGTTNAVSSLVKARLP